MDGLIGRLIVRLFDWLIVFFRFRRDPSIRVPDRNVFFNSPATTRTNFHPTPVRHMWWTSYERPTGKWWIWARRPTFSTPCAGSWRCPSRKPLILMTPKSLLRLPEARSSFDDMLPQSDFQRIIPDGGSAEQNPQAVKRVVFCSGKVFYELQKERRAKGLDEEVALIRIEQVRWHVKKKPLNHLVASWVIAWCICWSFHLIVWWIESLHWGLHRLIAEFFCRSVRSLTIWSSNKSSITRTRPWSSHKKSTKTAVHGHTCSPALTTSFGTTSKSHGGSSELFLVIAFASCDFFH